MDLIADSNRGIYAPQAFVQAYQMGSKRNFGCELQDIAIVLKGPEQEHYWEAWDSICDDFDDNGKFIHEEEGNIFLTTHGGI